MPEGVTWVKELPKRKAGPGRISRWKPTVDTLVAHPGKLALVHAAETAIEAESARSTLVAHARKRNVELQVFVRDTNVYAKVG
jgi:hypothetical protein